MVTKESVLKELGLSAEEWAALSKREQDKRLLALRQKWMQDNLYTRSDHD